MRDLYRRLDLDASADDGAVRAALATADGDTREAAEYILLNPARRAVYDRNRRVLLTVGRLRANLGLNLTRFWPRPRFGDFTIDLAPAASAPRPAAADPMKIAWALGAGQSVAGPKRGRRTVVAAIVAIAVLVLLVLAWWVLRSK